MNHKAEVEETEQIILAIKSGVSEKELMSIIVNALVRSYTRGYHTAEWLAQ